MKAAKSEIEELSQNFNGLVSSLQKVIRFTSPNQIPGIIAKLAEEKNEREADWHSATESHENFVSQLKTVISFQSEDQLPAKLSQMIQAHMEKANDLKELSEKHQTLVSSLVVALNCRGERQIHESVLNLIAKHKQTQAELEHERENHESLIRMLKKELNFSDETVLPQTVNRLVTENERLSKRLDDTTKQLNDIEISQEKLTSTLAKILGSKQSDNIVQEVSALVEEKARLEQSDTRYSTIMDQLHGLIDFKDDTKLPTLLEIRLQETKSTTKELQKRAETAENILTKVRASVPNVKLNELPDAVASVVAKAEETAISLKSLKKDHEKVMKSVLSITGQSPQSGVTSIVSQLTEKTQELEDIRQDHTRLVSSLQKVTDCIDSHEIPTRVQAIVDELDHVKAELEEQTTKHNSLIHSLRNSISFQDESEVPSLIAEMSDNLANTQTQNDRNEKTLTSLCNSLNITAFAELPKSVDRLKSECEQMKGVIDNISTVTEQKEMRKIPDIVRSIKSDLANAKRDLTSASELVNAILTRMCKKKTTVAFPLDSNLQSKIIKSFSDYADKKDAMQSDFDTLMANARSLGFQGHSCVEASDFLADELCKKKAHEQLEQMVSQMKQLREDKERERAVLEKRNRSTHDKLKELRRAKAELIEESAAKQTELYDTIDGLRKEIRDLETKVEHLTRIKEELIRVCAREVYDKDALKKWLTSAEMQKLKL